MATDVKTGDRVRIVRNRVAGGTDLRGTRGVVTCVLDGGAHINVLPEGETDPTRATRVIEGEYEVIR
jgi:hypothetical protein